MDNDDNDDNNDSNPTAVMRSSDNNTIANDDINDNNVEDEINNKSTKDDDIRQSCDYLQQRGNFCVSTGRLRYCRVVVYRFH